MSGSGNKHMRTRSPLEILKIKLNDDQLVLYEMIEMFFDQQTKSLEQLIGVFQSYRLAKDKEINELNGEINVLNAIVNELNEIIITQEVYSRLNNLVISGNGISSSSPDECLDDVVVQLFESNLNVNITQGDISAVHRLDKLPYASQVMRSRLLW